MRKTTKPVRKPATTRKPATAKKPAPPAKPSNDRDVTQYADKEPTDLHRAYGNWIVTEVGYNPNAAKTKAEAFLMGVSIATAARPAFQGSDWLAEWREEAGVAKRGRKSTKDTEAEAEDFVDAESEEDESEEDIEEDLDALEEELNGMAIGALRKMAKEEYEVSGSGTKKEIINRILDAAAEESEEDEPEDDEDEPEDDEEGVDLEELADELKALSPAELKEAAEEYGVTPKRGERKAALIDRILDAVEEEASEEDEEDEEDEPEETPAKPARKAAGSKSKDFLF